jgi:hypothetical protein
VNDQPNWNPEEPFQSMQEWALFLHAEAKRLFRQDGTHASMLFSFKELEGIVSVNAIPPNFNDYDALNESIADAILEYDLFGVILIGETWMYFIKEKDHTAFQLLDGEMRVSDLNAEDKKEALMVKMESQNGECITYLNQIIRDEKDGLSLKEEAMISKDPAKWFVTQSL